MREKICKISKEIMDYVIENSFEKPEKDKLYFNISTQVFTAEWNHTDPSRTQM